jgi:hypothetical protein
MILWICKDDVYKITNEINTYVLVKNDELNHKFIQQNYSNFVLRKQLHMCQPEGCYKTSKHLYMDSLMTLTSVVMQKSTKAPINGNIFNQNIMIEMLFLIIPIYF